MQQQGSRKKGAGAPQASQQAGNTLCETSDCGGRGAASKGTSVMAMRQAEKETAREQGGSAGSAKPSEPLPEQGASKFTTMYYAKTGHVGIREKGGNQKLQIGKPGVERAILEEQARALIGMLGSGVSVDAVKQHWRDKVRPSL